jgi:Putative peptidoglycan binding domain
MFALPRGPARRSGRGVRAPATLLRRRRPAVPATLGAGALAVTAVAGLTLLGGDGDEPRRSAGPGAATVPVTRQTLVERETVDGTLGFSGTRTVINRLGVSGAPSSSDGGSSGTPSQPEAQEPQAAQPSSGSGDYAGSGTVTALARSGAVVRRGGVLYRLDGDPVLLMYGSTPAYRDLESGISDGRDVRQLERNLAALGFDPGTVDETFTSSTAAAVMGWQAEAGLTESGAVELGRIVFLPGARRIGERKTAVGGVVAAGSEVLDTTSTKRAVSIELDAGLQSLAHRGDRVEVALPDSSTVRGRITDVGRVAREKESSDAAATATSTEPELVIDVTVELRSAPGIGRLDEAPVGVGLAQESRENVLAVPVDALVARRGGGYGVELAAGQRVVPVRTGLFADGYVEISGAAIRAGTRVVVPNE